MLSLSPPAEASAGTSPRTVRVLLITTDTDEAIRISECLAALPDLQIALDWVATRDAGETAIARRGHDVYLVDFADAGGYPRLPASGAGVGTIAAPLIALIPAGDPLAARAAAAAAAVGTIARGEGDARDLGLALDRALRPVRPAESRGARDLATFIAALPMPVAVLDERRTIIAANAAWRRQVEEWPLPWPAHGLGLDYLAVHAALSAETGDDAALARGLADVASGALPEFAHDVRQHWDGCLALRATRLADPELGCLLIVHDDSGTRGRGPATHRHRGPDFRALVEHLPGLVVRFDRHLRPVYANPAALDAIDQFIGPRPAGSDPEGRGRLLARLAAWLRDDVEAVFATEREATVAYDVTTLPRRRTYQVRLIPELGPGGATESVLVTGHDITARVRSELALRASEEQYRQLLEQAADGILVLSADRRILIANDRVCALSGYTHGELLALTAADLVPPDEVDDLPGRVAQIQARGSAINQRLLRRKDGATVPVEVGVNTLADGRLQIVMRDLTERVRAAAALRQSEDRLRAVVDNIPLVLFAYDRDGVLTLLEGRGLAALGWRPEECVGRPARELYGDQPALLADLGHALAGESLTVCQRIGERVLETHYSPVRDADGAVTGVTGVAIDVTDRVHSEEALRRSTAQLAESQRLAHLGRWDFDLRTRRIACSDELHRIYGLDPAQVQITEATFWALVHPEDRAKLRDAFTRSRETCDGFELTYRALRADGTSRVLELHAAVACDDEGRPVRQSGTVLDVTERANLEERLIHEGFHDTLTGLPNRVLFFERLGHALVRKRRRSRNVAVLYLDLDRFKDVNDTLGHDVGDQLLVAIAERLRGAVGDEHTAARLGGDEFAVLLEEQEAPDEAVHLAERLIATLRQPLTLGGREHSVTASIGIVVGGAEYARAEEVLRDADVAMYRAKLGGKARIAVFDPAMQAELAERLQLEHDLWLALARDEFSLHYQPIYDLSTGRPVEVEALVRWHHPERGMIAPNTFIPIAEECGAIQPLGRWVLREACRQGRRWLDRQPASGPIMVAVNLSAREFQHAELVTDVAATLAETGLPADLLRLEITESVAMGDAEATLRVLGELKRLGVKLAIDDFGTGYSSLAYLQRFPVDALKIDRAFINNLAGHSTSREICRAIASLAKALRLEITAEGIETKAQVRLVRAILCDRAQGYFYSRPLPPEALEPLLALGEG